MAVIRNYCKPEIRFICNTHDQSSCIYFEPDNNIPSLTCKFGLPDRKCRNEKAIKQSFRSLYKHKYLR